MRAARARQTKGHSPRVALAGKGQKQQAPIPGQQSEKHPTKRNRQQ